MAMKSNGRNAFSTTPREKVQNGIETEADLVENTLILRVRVGTSLTIGSDSLLVNQDEFEKPRNSRFCSWGISEIPRNLSIPFYNILWAEIVEGHLVINYAIPSKEDVIPATLSYPLNCKVQPVEEWITKLLLHSYRDSQVRKRAKVLVNPHSGRGKARSWYSKLVEPLLRAARCSYDVVETTRSGEGILISEEMDIDEFDMILVCSGDGLAHEVFNGLGKRSDARKAFKKVAVAHVPCGSGNGLSHNLNATGNASKATLAIIKGVRQPLDLVSITQGERRTLSFLSQSTGMAAESDLATENWRWMGDTRFKIGFLTRILAQKVYPADLAVKIAVENKPSIMDHYKREISKHSSIDSQKSSQYLPEEDHLEEDQKHNGLPPLKYGTIKDETPEDWAIIPCNDLGILYCGNIAYMGADAKFFPTALHNDGLMDLVLIDGNIPRLQSLEMFDALKNETFFDLPVVKYRKIVAYRWTPRNQDSGYISVDGERVLFKPYQAEIHKGLATVIMKNDRIPGAPPSI